MNNWAFQWKIQFNPDRNKQAQELYFSKKAGNQTSLSKNYQYSYQQNHYLKSFVRPNLDYGDIICDKSNK